MVRYDAKRSDSAGTAHPASIQSTTFQGAGWEGPERRPQPIQVLTSLENPLLKEVRRAINRGTLTRDGYAVAEGVHLLEEALRSGCAIGCVLAAESARAAVETRLPGDGRRHLRLVDDRVFRSLAATESSQGVITLARAPTWTPDRLFGANPLIVVLDRIQDPGNAGAILRAAEAFSATGAVFVKGSVNPYNPKALRASAGSALRLPMLAGSTAEEALDLLRTHGVAAYAMSPSGAEKVGMAALSGPAALIVGSEGSGLAGAFRRLPRIGIPTRGVESLNAAMAVGILLYEASRQRGRLP